jgi:acetoin utilization deacetylase AcuC-like enzyme
VRAWSSARFTIALPDGHRFPLAKYARLRDEVIARSLLSADAVEEPDRIERWALELVHQPAYVQAVLDGSLTPVELRRLGLPWSPGLRERSLRTVQGTVEAARDALAHGLGIALAGGTHHAFPGHGEGFCVFNDVAVAIRVLQREGRITRAVVVDLDVHQGNGTNAIFADDPTVFTFSMHGGKNYPFHKVAGSLDIELPDRTADDFYLDTLAGVLPHVIAQSAPDLVIYLAGADPHEGGRLGRLRLTFDGLARRDAMVLDACREVGIPVVITIAGGYGRNIEDSVAVHVNTVRVASSYL